MKTLKLHFIFVLFVFPLLAAVYTKCAFGQSWQAMPGLPPNEPMKLIAVHPENPALSFVVTDGNVYASADHGKDWKQVLHLGSQTEIYDLQFNQNRIFLLTSDGLFEAKDAGKKWKKIFDGLHGEKSVRSLTSDPNKKQILYLGTSRGLFISEDNGLRWKQAPVQPDRHLIHQLRSDLANNELFILTDQGLYRLIPAHNRLDRVYVMKTAAALESLEEEETEDPEEIPPAQIKTFLITSSSSIVMVTENSILVSEDEGNFWEHLSSSGLPKASISDLVYSDSQNTFFVATEKGVYVYLSAEKRWKELSNGLPFEKIERLTLLKTGGAEILHAASKSGIYKIVIDPSLFQPEQIKTFSQEKWNLLMNFFHYEPAVGEVQKQAIRYANVHKNKTKRWQWSSRMKALVPSISIGKDFSKGDTVDIDRGGTNDPDRYILGPTDTNNSWSADVKWELSDLIWNTAQTSIDSREKSMVELRGDILNEVTRLYFERRRAQIEFVLRQPQDSFEQANTLLRIEELTAHLDALTDGYLTKESSVAYARHPELENLWILEMSEDAKTP